MSVTPVSHALSSFQNNKGIIVKRIMPWLCLAAVTPVSVAFASSGIEDYRKGDYFNALQNFSKQTKHDPVESYYLGQMNLYGYGQLKNNPKAIRYYTQAAEGGHLSAQAIMARYMLLAKKDPVQALYWFKKSAAANDLQAQMYCAGAYLFGLGVSKNIDKARQYFIAAARQGNSVAQYTLADYFLDSRQASNKQLGLIWLGKAVTQKNPMAQLLQGKLYAEGKIVAKNMDQANQLIDEAVAEGYAPAMIQKGNMARDLKDFDRAKEWYSQAVNAGYQSANVSLGNLYLDEKAPFYDAHVGFLLILKAAQANLLEGQSALAALYKSGKGVAADLALAKEWEVKAQKNPASSAMAQAASWISNGQSTEFASLSDFQLKGIFDQWTNPDSIKENVYNPSPKLVVVTREMLYKPNFVLTTPNDIGIGEYYDALTQSIGALAKDDLKFGQYPMDESLTAVKAAAESKDDKLKSMIEKISNEAILGDAVAEFDLGQINQYGIGTEVNISEAIRNYELAANQEELSAMCALGVLYLEGGADLKPDYAKGMAWLQNAAFKGSSYAQFTLAQIYEHGLKDAENKEVIQPDPQQTDSMYFLAAASGSGDAQYRLAENLVRQKPDDVSNVAKASRQALIKSLYQSAVANGFKDAALPLAFFNAMDPDKTKQNDAFKVAKEEAEAKNPMAALLLGLMYDRGLGVEASQDEALFWYQKSGKNPVSDFIIGTYYSLGKGVEHDNVKGLAMLQESAATDFSYADLNVAILNHEKEHPFLPQLEKALDLGNSKAGLLLADYYLSLAPNYTQMAKARDIYESFARKGDKEAQLKFAFMNEQGLGGKIDFQNALAWYTQAAAQDQPVAQYLLGRLYQFGYLDPKPDYALAKQWYSRAKSTYAPAAIALGFVYDTVEDNYQQAGTSYQIAADQHDPIAQFNLGLIYEEGKGQKVDLDKARALYQEAAEKGLSNAMVRLAGLYFGDTDGLNDPQLALDWYRKAADLGNRDALYQLGLFAETGIGVKIDYKSALEYYEKSAQLGNQQAMFAAARMFQYGLGVPQNKKQAAVYYEILAGLGNAFGQYQLAGLYDEKVLPETKLGERKKLLIEALKNGSPQAEKALQKLAIQQQGLSFVEPVIVNHSPVRAGKPVELMYLDALNQWNHGDEAQSKMIFDCIRAQYPDYIPAKRVYEQMRLG